MRKNYRNKNLPKLAEFIVKKILPDEGWDSPVGDFQEDFNEAVSESGVFRAWSWYLVQILKLLPQKMLNKFMWSVLMFKNYMRIAFRNIKRHKGYSFINIFGLVTGLTSCIMIVSYVLFELSFDRYHKNADRIFRFAASINMSGKTTKLAVTDAPAAPALINDYPEVLDAVRFYHVQKVPVSYKDRQFYEENIFLADKSVFNVFSFSLISGDPNTALQDPYSVVVTEETAEKYFADEEPIGKIIKFNNRIDLRVAGVVKNIPENSHFKFDMLGSIQFMYAQSSGRMQQWLNSDFYTYILLNEKSDYRELESKFPAFIDKYIGESLKGTGIKFEFFLQPLTSIHLFSKLEAEITGNSDITYIYVFIVIAAFILLIACINYMNLTTARSNTRAGEIGMRKILGSDRKMLIKQFLEESLLYSIFSFLIAFILAIIIFPVFSSISGKNLSINFTQFPFLIPGFLIIAVFTGILAGSYPAFFLSSFKPLRILRGNLRYGRSASFFRNSLVTVQFIISITLIIGIFIILNQLKFMKNKRLGFDKEHVVVLPVMDGSIKRSLETLKEDFLSYEDIMSMGFASHMPGERPPSHGFIPEGLSENQTQLMMDINCDTDFITTMGMEIVEGRNFSKDFSSDLGQSVIINETAAKKYGWEKAVGKIIYVITGSGTNKRTEKKTVIGVVKDFHMVSMHKIIVPVIIRYESNPLNYIFIRTRKGDIGNTIEYIRERWKTIDPNRPFEYLLLDENFDRQYAADERLSEIFTGFTLLSIFIACLGLFGLVSFTTAQRTKEIGIRKVLGASVSGIVLMISKDFLKWLILANVIAWPVSYFFMHRWLQSFAYRTNIGILIFIFSGILALITALLTVSFQSVKAARTNPVSSLKYE